MSSALLRRGPSAHLQSTPYQRLTIRTLFFDIDLPLDRITRLHASVFADASVVLPAEGLRVDDALTELTRDSATALITALTRRVQGAA